MFWATWILFFVFGFVCFCVGLAIGEAMETKWAKAERLRLTDVILGFEARNERLNRDLASCQREILQLRRKFGERSFACAGGPAEQEPWTTSQEF